MLHHRDSKLHRAFPVQILEPAETAITGLGRWIFDAAVALKGLGSAREQFLAVVHGLQIRVCRQPQDSVNQRYRLHFDLLQQPYSLDELL